MKVRFGIIGCGHIAPKHADAIMNSPLMELKAVCDINPSAARDFGEKYGVKWYTDVKDLLDSPDIDVVNICTPSGLRVEIGLQAVEAGKHLVVEKPMALALKEADILIRACRDREVKLSVMHQNRYIPAVRKMMKALRSGRFGKLTHGSAVVRWNRNDEYYAKAPWRGTKAMDGGCMLNQAIHNIDLLQFALGDAQVVFGFTATQLRKIETEDNVVAVIKFANGSLGTIEASTTIYPGNLEENLSVFGSEGTAVLGGVAMGKLRAWRLAGDDEAAVLAEQDNEPEQPRYACHQAVLEDMAMAIIDNRKPAIDGLEGRKALAIIEAIYRSNDTGMPVYLGEEK
ncbi:MAG: 1,5-anhydro-D-fructose reductase [Pelotomaculum sp. PtaU1.Bin065]|nr:MAG: 1,5-anhydro-D-fructose reductase [Pelotomaculum sp. PtaU1.Bin065]